MPHDFLNSMFTSAASVCVAGLATVVPAEQYTLFGKIVMLVLIQIGALGFIFIITAFFLIAKRKLSFKDKINIGTALGTPENLTNIKVLIKRIVVFTLLSELIGAVIFGFRFIPTYGVGDGILQSVFTSISAFCNCGFDILGPNSLKDFAVNHDYLVLSTCAVLTFLGSLGFIVWNELYEKHMLKVKNKLSFKKVWYMYTTHTQLTLLMTAIMIILGTISFLAIEYNNPATLGSFEWFDKIFLSIFHGISARTTGMVAINISQLTNSGKLMTIILMLIGGAPGSTAGGIKTVTFAVLLLTMINNAAGNKNVNLFRKEISNETIKQAVTIIFSALIILLVMTIILCALNPQIEFIDILFEVSSSLATCGYSTGITTTLTSASKVVLIVLMYIGRVSTVTMTMAITGKRFKQSNLINYPKAEINI